MVNWMRNSPRSYNRPSYRVRSLTGYMQIVELPLAIVSVALAGSISQNSFKEEQPVVTDIFARLSNFCTVVSNVINLHRVLDLNLNSDFYLHNLNSDFYLQLEFRFLPSLFLSQLEFRFLPWKETVSCFEHWLRGEITQNFEIVILKRLLFR